MPSERSRLGTSSSNSLGEFPSTDLPPVYAIHAAKSLLCTLALVLSIVFG
jgi:hypothetical protein